MKENKYDEDAFFRKYADMERSKKGLTAAGEWKTLQKLLPDFSGKRVLDLGCGYGWHCRYAAERGAAKVVGADISSNMIAVAKEKNRFSSVEYINAAIEDLNFNRESFDAVISSLAFHYVRDFHAAVQNVFGWLVSGGDFVFSAEHPVFTSRGDQDWFYGQGGEILHFPVDNYFSEGQRDAVFLGEHVIKYHRTLETYVGELLSAGFQIRGLAEPKPPEDMLCGEMLNELRRPMMLIIAAKKP